MFIYILSNMLEIFEDCHNIVKGLFKSVELKENHRIRSLCILKDRFRFLVTSLGPSLES
jgi:hypothetical protein